MATGTVATFDLEQDRGPTQVVEHDVLNPGTHEVCLRTGFRASDAEIPAPEFRSVAVDGDFTEFDAKRNNSLTLIHTALLEKATTFFSVALIAGK